VGKRGASVPPQELLLLRTIVFQGLRRRLLLQGFRGVGRPRPGQRDGGRSQGDEALDAAARQGRKEQHGGGAAASWRHAFPRAHLVAVPRGWGGRSGGGEGGGVGKELDVRPSAGLVHLEGRKRGRQEVFEQLSRGKCDAARAWTWPARATEAARTRRWWSMRSDDPFLCGSPLLPLSNALH